MINFLNIWRWTLGWTCIFFYSWWLKVMADIWSNERLPRFQHRCLIGECWKLGEKTIEKLGPCWGPIFGIQELGSPETYLFNQFRYHIFWELLRAWWQRQEIDNMRGQHHDVAKQQQELLQILGLTLVLELFVLSDTDNGLIHDLPFGFLPSTFPVKPSLCRKKIYIYAYISTYCIFSEVA